MVSYDNKMVLTLDGFVQTAWIELCFLGHTPNSSTGSLGCLISGSTPPLGPHTRPPSFESPLSSGRRSALAPHDPYWKRLVCCFRSLVLVFSCPNPKTKIDINRPAIILRVAGGGLPYLCTSPWATYPPPPPKVWSPHSPASSASWG